MNRVLVRAAALCLGLVLAGCGVGGLLLGSAGGGGGGGGSTQKPPPPTTTVATPSGSASNFVSFRFALRDPQVKDQGPPPPDPDGEPTVVLGPRVRVTPQFSILRPQGQPDFWIDMTEARIFESEGTRALHLGQHTFVWNTLVDLGAFNGRVKVRVLAEYEEGEEISRSFKVSPAEFRIDNRLAGTVAGADAQAPNDVDTFPVDMRPDGSAFLVASFGANIVERVDNGGRVERVLGYGVPGDTVGNGQNPGVVRLPTLVAFDQDVAGNLYTNHSSALLVTNRGPVAFTFQGRSVPPETTVRVPTPFTYQSARGARFHPSGALIVANNQTAGIHALNGSPDPVTLAGTTIAPGEEAIIVGGPAASTTADGALALDTQLTDAAGVAVGPDGEIYYVERGPGRVRVVNTGAAPLTVGGNVIAPGTVATVAGAGLGFSGDGGPARNALLQLPGGIDVSPLRVLFIADTDNFVVRAANLGTAAQTFAQTTILPGNIDTVAGVADGTGLGGGVGSRALEIGLGRPNAVTLDAGGNLLIANQHQVILVNGGAASVTSYGKTAGPARTALVYDSTRRGGLPLVGPRAVHAASAEVLYFTDRSTVRVFNLTREPAIFGGAAADPGGTAIVAGGAVTGFAGDAGSARSAALANPSALVAEGPFRLYVADTDNDRIRLINVSDPRSTSVPQTAFGVSVAPGAIDTVAGGGPAVPAPFGDGGPPRAAILDAPQGVTISNAGLLFIADTGHHRIRVVNPGPNPAIVAGVAVAANTIATVIGGATAGFTPDGAGPWLIDTPTALTIDRDLLYFAEAGNARIRVLNLSAATVTCAGIDVPPSEVRTIAGNGVRGNAGDGGLGPDTSIDTPQGLFLQTLNGDRALLYFADGPQNVVRVLNLTSDTDLIGAVDKDGRAIVTIPAASVVTLSGGPNIPGFRNPPAFAGDTEEAAAMRFNNPFGIAITADPATGRPAHLFVADEGNNRLRRVGPPPLVLGQ